MIVLDTNVISELSRERPDSSVSAWFLGQQSGELVSSSITLAEILYGLELLPRGKRRERLTELSRIIFETALGGRILTFDSLAASHYGRLRAQKRRAGAPMAELDAQIAAIAQAAGASVATRNVDDFQNCGVPIINPWKK